MGATTSRLYRGRAGATASSRFYRGRAGAAACWLYGCRVVGLLVSRLLWCSQGRAGRPFWSWALHWLSRGGTGAAGGLDRSRARGVCWLDWGCRVGAVLCGLCVPWLDRGRRPGAVCGFGRSGISQHASFLVVLISGGVVHGVVLHWHFDRRGMALNPLLWGRSWVP